MRTQSWVLLQHLALPLFVALAVTHISPEISSVLYSIPAMLSAAYLYYAARTYAFNGLDRKKARRVSVVYRWYGATGILIACLGTPAAIACGLSMMILTALGLALLYLEGHSSAPTY